MRGGEGPRFHLIFTMSDYQNPTAYGISYGYESSLGHGMILIWEGHCNGVAEDCGCLTEPDAVFAPIRGIFARVPFEVHYAVSIRNMKGLRARHSMAFAPGGVASGTFSWMPLVCGLTATREACH